MQIEGIVNRTATADATQRSQREEIASYSVGSDSWTAIHWCKSVRMGMAALPQYSTSDRSTTKFFDSDSAAFCCPAPTADVSDETLVVSSWPRTLR